jgi:nickel-dependent lactate racemase
VKDAGKIVILVDDLSRPTPAHILFPAVMSEIAAAGKNPGQVTVVTALGTHRPMTSGELGVKIGREWAGRLRWENHDCMDKSRLIRLGKTGRGTPVFINSTVAGADAVISIGTIEPHTIAGFGGGYKNLVPGAAGKRTIGHSHTLNLSPENYMMVGRPCEKNPMRLDIEEAAGMLLRPFFMLNAVLDRKLDVLGVFAGHPIEAHRKGAEFCAGICGVRPPRKADVVLTASHPLDIDLRQGLRAVANTIRAVKPGGLLIDVIRAAEGTGILTVTRLRQPFGKRSVRALSPLFSRLIPLMRFRNVSEEDKYFMYFGVRAVRDVDIMAYAPTVPPEAAAAMPIVDFFCSTGDMMKAAAHRFPRGAEVLVFPAGGVTFPVFEE